MANAFYNFAKAEFLDADIDLSADTIKCALVSSAYTPNIDTDDFWNDVSANEISGTGYTAGGETLASKSVTQDNTGNSGVFDAADVTWSTSTITARGAVLYKDTGNAATSTLICYFDFGSDKSSSAGNFTLQWSGSGIIVLS